MCVIPYFDEVRDASGELSSHRYQRRQRKAREIGTTEVSTLQPETLRHDIPADGRYDRTANGVTSGPRDPGRSSSGSPDAI